MGQDENIAALRSRVSALVEQEGALLTQAFELSREGADRRGVDALFARVQAIQVERNNLQRRIGTILGTQRLHLASEVWRPGVYDYRQGLADAAVRVCVSQGPLGLLVLLPQRRDAVRIETLEGTFDGPLAVDDAAAHPGGEAAQGGTGDAAPAQAGDAAPARRRTARKKPG